MRTAVQNRLPLHRWTATVGSLINVHAMALMLVLVLPLRAEEAWEPPAEFIGGLRTWLEENVDESAFEVVGLEPAEVDAGLEWLQEQARQTRAHAGATGREDAEALIQTLDGFEVTSPAAEWLRTLLGKQTTASPTPDPSGSVAPKTRATPHPARLMWEQRLATRPPPGRAARFLPELKAIFAEEGVPPELVWIAEVESGFDPSAQSPVGALGLFQLMPDTAEEMGLKVGLWTDERHDARHNARGAARYLRTLQRQFQDWPLTLAAYNAGPGRVAYLLKKTGAQTFGDIAERLPEETRQYVPRVEATVWVREGVDVRDLPASDRRARTAGAPITDPPVSGSAGPG